MPSLSQKETARERLTRKYSEFLTQTLTDVESDISTPLVKGVPGHQQNLSGNAYSGANPFFLSMVAAANGWELPIWMTWNQLDELGLNNKGAHSHPVQRWVPFSVKDKETGKAVDMTESQYNALPKDVKDLYEVTRPKLLVFDMFNIDQTNFSIVYPDVYRKLQETFLTRSHTAAECAVIDKMLEDSQYGWACPVRTDPAAAVASYDPDYDNIIVPPKEKYLDQRDYYSELLRCMAESTCMEERLDIDFTRNCGDTMTPVAMRMLATELSSATLLTMFGFQPTMSERGRSHIKAWKGAIDRNPALTLDIIKASGEASEFVLSRLGLGQEQGMDIQKIMDGVELAEENRRKYREKIERYRERKELKQKNSSKGKGWTIEKTITTTIARTTKTI